MENKYYIPKIEEFCVGFQYEEYREESLVVSKWEENIFGLHNKLENLDLTKIRVKYLDLEDIENLGYTRDFIRTKITTNIGFWIKNNEIYAWYNTLTYELNIYKIEYNSSIDRCFTENVKTTLNSYYIFKGTIKNIMELQKLIIQLGIK